MRKLLRTLIILIILAISIPLIYILVPGAQQPIGDFFSGILDKVKSIPGVSAIFGDDEETAARNVASNVASGANNNNSLNQQTKIDVNVNAPGARDPAAVADATARAVGGTTDQSLRSAAQAFAVQGT